MPGEVITKEDWLSISSPDDVCIGIDEAGRGAWAGPIVVGVCELRPSDYTWTLRLKDSKKLSPMRRQDMAKLILNSYVRFDIGEVDAKDIDEYHIDQATGVAAVMPMERLWVPSMRHVPFVFDGLPKNWHDMVHEWLAKHVNRWYFLPKADNIVPAVSAASILAKVHHDAVMDEEAREEPIDTYDWLKNKGYGSDLHRKALMDKGPSSFHRMSYSPMKELFHA